MFLWNENNYYEKLFLNHLVIIQSHLLYQSILNMTLLFLLLIFYYINNLFLVDIFLFYYLIILDYDKYKMHTGLVQYLQNDLYEDV